MRESLENEDVDAATLQQPKEDFNSNFQKLANKLVVAAVAIFFFLGLYLGFKSGAVLPFIGKSLLVLFPYIFLSLFTSRSKWIHYASIGALSGLSLLIFYQSGGEAVFSFSFLLSAVLQS